MRKRFNAVTAVAALAILDALRRKDLYVMAILCGLMIAAGRLFALGVFEVAIFWFLWWWGILGRRRVE